MTDAIISNVSQSGGSGGLPMESVSLNYATMTVTYTQTDPSSAGAQGSLTGGWDFGTNQPV
jgi:type VI protein secretion system component Hcp